MRDGDWLGCENQFKGSVADSFSIDGGITRYVPPVHDSWRMYFFFQLSDILFIDMFICEREISTNCLWL